MTTPRGFNSGSKPLVITREGTFSKEIMDAFWEWLPRWYSEEEIETIKQDPSVFLRHFLSNVSGTQFDPSFKEDIGAQRKQLRERDEMLRTLYPDIDPEQVDKDKVERLRAEGRVGVGGIPEWQLERWEQRIDKGEISQEAVSSFIDRREESQQRRERRARQRAQWQFAPPRPEFGAGFEEVKEGVGGTLPFQDWFGSRFPSLVAKFQATLPDLTQAGFPGLTPRQAETQIEQQWAEVLKRRTPQLREEFATRFPFGPQGRPERFAPRIQTVGF